MHLYAIRFAQHFKFGTYRTVFNDGENPDKKIEDFAFIFYLAKYRKKYLLFDTGFRDEGTALSMGVDLLSVQKEVVQVFGEIPEIDTVVLTHHHWDHLENLDLYPHARIIISAESYKMAKRECERPSVLEILEHGKTVFVKEDLWIEDKFHMRVVGGHSPGSSIICFEEGGRDFVLTGDECYLCENLWHKHPVGIFVNTENNKNFITEAHEKGWIPLPCHDAGILERYERVSENIVKIL